jgi:transposase
MPGPNIVLRRQARKMVYDVYCFMEKEAKTEKETVKRTAEATKTSERTVRRIVKEGSNSELLIVFRTPGKKRNKTKPITDIDSFDQSVVRTCIHNYHITNKELPTIEKLRKKLKDDINFNGSERSLRRIFNNLGFRWKKAENNRKILIEKSNIRLLRIEYREEGRPIIYTDESYVDSSHSGMYQLYNYYNFYRICVKSNRPYEK